MPISIKALIVVLGISAVVFQLVKPTALIFSNENDFRRRRNAFYALTCLAFLSPNFWLYAAVSAPILFVCGRKDSNPSAFYLFLLHVIPPVFAALPVFGLNSHLELDNQRLLSILVIIPAIGRVRRSRPEERITGLRLPDWCLLAYGVLSSILYLHLLAPDGAPYPFSTTDLVRRTLLFLIGGFAPYFVISRSSSSRQAMLDNASALLIPCLVMAAIAVFETVKGWLLYETIPVNWELAASFTSYLLRGSSLRAMASAGHSLALGYFLDIAFGVWLALCQYVPSRLTKAAISALLLLGLLAAYSRGPWVCAILIYFVFIMQKRRAFSALPKAMAGIAAIAALLWLSPLGQKIADVVPFLGGSVDTGSIDYRQHLWERTWAIVQQSPLFGDQYALSKMQELRQGQGIVDFVNGYAQELLSTGFTGLSLFLFIVLTVLLKTFSASRAIKASDQSLGMVGASFVCCMLGTLFLWALGGPNEATLWALVALGIGYSFLGAVVRADSPGKSPATTKRRPTVAL
jgi:O-antigen ligase